MKTPGVYDLFFGAVRNMVSLTDKEQEAFADILIYRSVPKRFMLVNVGDISREAYFINSGCVRLFYRKDGEEVNANFVFENSFIASLESFLLQVPSRQAVETLEDCELVVLQKERLTELINKYPRIERFSKAIAERAFIILQRRASSFILDSPEERYMKMLNEHPQISSRIPQHMIASYLGVTPVSLSRIRKRISGNAN